MMHTPAFITGSYAYGIPTEQSDIDIVVFMYGRDAKKLLSIVKSDGVHHYDDTVDCSFRFAKLNLIQLDDEIKYLAWLEANQFLKKIAATKGPVSREFAKETILSYIAIAQSKLKVAVNVT